MLCHFLFDHSGVRFCPSLLFNLKYHTVKTLLDIKADRLETAGFNENISFAKDYLISYLTGKFNTTSFPMFNQLSILGTTAQEENL